MKTTFSDPAEPRLSLTLTGMCLAKAGKFSGIVQLTPMAGSAQVLELLTTHAGLMENAVRTRKCELTLWGHDITVELVDGNPLTGALRISAAPVLEAVTRQIRIEQPDLYSRGRKSRG